MKLVLSDQHVRHNMGEYFVYFCSFYENSSHSGHSWIERCLLKCPHGNEALLKNLSEILYILSSECKQGVLIQTVQYISAVTKY